MTDETRDLPFAQTSRRRFLAAGLAAGTAVWLGPGQGWVKAARLQHGHVAEQRDLGLNVPQLSSFGTGPDGELYALSLTGPVFRLADTTP